MEGCMPSRYIPIWQKLNAWLYKELSQITTNLPPNPISVASHLDPSYYYTRVADLRYAHSGCLLSDTLLQTSCLCSWHNRHCASTPQVSAIQDSY